MAFLEQRLPIGVTYGSTGGPSYRTRVVTSGSGFEDRNSDWSSPRHTFEWETAGNYDSDMEVLTNFFHALKGAWCGFRVRDNRDYKSCVLSADPAFDDQVIGQGDGVTLEFQLIKTYTIGLQSTVRKISKLDLDAVPLVGVSGAPVLQGDGTYPWAFDITTGLITFTGTAPPAGDVTAGYIFDVPVRFLTDSLMDVYLSYSIGKASIPIVEIRV